MYKRDMTKHQDKVLADVVAAHHEAQQALQRLERVTVDAIAEMVPRDLPMMPVEQELADLIGRTRNMQQRRYVSAIALFSPRADIAKYGVERGAWRHVGHDSEPDSGVVAFQFDGVEFCLHDMHRDGHVITEEERAEMWRKRCEAEREATAVTAHQATAHDYSGCPEDGGPF